MFLAGTFKINYKQHLVIGGCDAVELAGQYGTPLYVMDEELIRDNCRRYLRALKKNYPQGKIIYAGKALLVKAMVNLVKEEGLGLMLYRGRVIYRFEKRIPCEQIYSMGTIVADRDERGHRGGR